MDPSLGSNGEGSEHPITRGCQSSAVVDDATCSSVQNRELVTSAKFSYVTPKNAESKWRLYSYSVVANERLAEYLSLSVGFPLSCSRSIGSYTDRDKSGF